MGIIFVDKTHKNPVNVFHQKFKFNVQPQHKFISTVAAQRRNGKTGNFMRSTRSHMGDRTGDIIIPNDRTYY